MSQKELHCTKVIDATATADYTAAAAAADDDDDIGCSQVGSLPPIFMWPELCVGGQRESELLLFGD